MSTTIALILTIIGGSLTFSMGQFLLKAVLEPFLELKRQIGEIAHDLDFYANQMYGEAPLGDEARQKFRRHSCKLREKVTTILWYKAFHSIFGLPKRCDIVAGSRKLMGFSNRSRNPQPGEYPTDTDVKKLLRIDT